MTKHELSKHLLVNHFNEKTIKVFKSSRTPLPDAVELTSLVTISSTGTRSFRCPLCPHQTKSKDMITNHMLGHTKESINFDCHLCGKNFLNAALFKDHVAKRHYQKKVNGFEHKSQN
jgi:hypothetical protein